jgi:hypothetical protein
MNVRKLLTGALLAFVVVSFGFLALRSMKATKCWRAPQTTQAASVAPEDEKRATGKIIAYYSHITVRCTTCRTWVLVGDKLSMQQYVEEEVRRYLRKL